jgi:carboxyl-terminal processing protease
VKCVKNRIAAMLLILLALYGGYQLGQARAEWEYRDAVIPEGVDTDTGQTLEKAEYLKTFIQQNYLFDTTEEEMNEGMLKGLFLSLGDPYSQYMNADEFTALMEDNAGSFGGIGITVSPGEEDNLITVVAPIRDTPGERAGIQPGDKIIKIEGTEYTGDQMDAAVKEMRGEAGTNVNITIRRLSPERPPEEFDLEITREIINIISAQGEMLNDTIGYLAISSFDENTDRYFSNALKEIKEQGAQGIVLDLRNNPGGLLDSVLAIADDLLPEGPVVITRTKNGQEVVERSDRKMDAIPMTVLINKGSASASEILAGAIQDYERAPIIGETSFGKGIVQRIIPLDDGSGFKLTVSEYYTPEERKIHEIGVVPDIEVAPPEEVLSFGPEFIDTDIQLQRAMEELQKQIGE